MFSTSLTEIVNTKGDGSVKSLPGHFSRQASNPVIRGKKKPSRLKRDGSLTIACRIEIIIF